MLLSVFCRLAYQVEHLTPAWFYLLGAQTDSQTLLSEHLTITPEISFHEGRDLLHNRLLYGILPPGAIEITYRAQIQVVAPVISAPLGVAPDTAFLQPSRYCCPVQLKSLLQEILRGDESQLQAAEQICSWVNQHLRYRCNSSAAGTRAIDILLRGEGVCRDFSHVAISLCRAAGLPARYVSGYAYQLDPPDFHALFEVFAEGHWHLMDATRLAKVDQFARIGVGRDAADIPVAEFSEPVRYTGLTIQVEQRPAWEQKESA
jgi:transglutaminase-like putative cysteine protease